MSRIKTATSALTAALLVTGIGLAVAQTAEPTQPADPMAAATAKPSENTPADPNAQTQPVQPVAPTDTTAPAMQQPTTPPVDTPSTTTPLPSDPATRTTPSNAYPANNGTMGNMPSSNDSMTTTSEPAPRADRN